VLLLPVFQGLALGDSLPHVHPLFRWLLAVHIVVGIVNYLPTRFAWPALVFGLSQACFAFYYLPGGQGFTFFADPVAAGVVGLTFSLILLFIEGVKASAPVGIEKLWRDFRNMYGLVWGLRIAERLNAAATKHGWPVEFTWGGMIVKTESGTLEPEVQHRVERELRSHLRRFVSHEWIVKRLQGDT
jgi:hypothetical protein